MPRRWLDPCVSVPYLPPPRPGEARTCSRAKRGAANDIQCPQHDRPTAASREHCCCCVATMYGGYAFPSYGTTGMYAQMNPGWFGVPHVLPPPQAQGTCGAGAPALQQLAQPDIRQQQCQQEQGGTQRDMDVDHDHQRDELFQAQHARVTPKMVSAATQTLLTGTGIQTPGDEAQGETASGKRALLVRRAPVGQLPASEVLALVGPGRRQNLQGTERGGGVIIQNYDSTLPRRWVNLIRACIELRFEPPTDTQTLTSPGASGRTLTASPVPSSPVPGCTLPKAARSLS